MSCVWGAGGGRFLLQSRSLTPTPTPHLQRQDSGCGSTIGPIVATNLGMRTVDVGVPQLSMHSVREMCGAEDVGHSITLLSTFFSHYPKLEAALSAEV